MVPCKNVVLSLVRLNRRDLETSGGSISAGTDRAQIVVLFTLRSQNIDSGGNTVIVANASLNFHSFGCGVGGYCVMTTNERGVAGTLSRKILPNGSRASGATGTNCPDLPAADQSTSLVKDSRMAF